MRIIYRESWLMIPIFMIASLLVYNITWEFKECNISFVKYGIKKSGNKEVQIAKGEDTVYNVLSLGVFIGQLLIIKDLIDKYVIKYKIVSNVRGVPNNRIVIIILAIEIAILMSVLVIISNFWME